MRWAFAAAAICVFTTCKQPPVTTNKCIEDSACGAPASAYRCEPQTGVCYCRTNDACPARQYCNPAGFCQDRAGCEKNTDCLDDSLFCDTSTGTCLSVGRCSTDLQCALGQICDTSRATCVPGCRSSGDCPGSACRCGDAPCVCTGATAAERAQCAMGECDPNFCTDKSFCKFGEKCGLLDAGVTGPDAGAERNTCFDDFDEDRRPYCARCTSGGGISTCGTGANYCITDTRTASTYCGTDCSSGETCPRGYGCRDIIVVFSRWQCSATQPCEPDPNVPCAVSADCKRGGTCDNGRCRAVCRLREGSQFGFCSCQVNDDCAQETCSAGECSISRKKCIDADDCRPINCVEFQGAGGCLIGQNCTPENGLTCVEVGRE